MIKIDDVVFSTNFNGFFTVERIQAGSVYLINCAGIRKIENIEDVRLVKK